MRRAGPVEDEIRAFGERVASLISEGKPVKIYAGCGSAPIIGFLNLDIRPHRPEHDRTFDDRELFFFPFTDHPWPIPDNSVDYVFDEDFIEHVPQKNQFCFLAETLRVLKPGCWHRVSTPCLHATMKRHSQFATGMRGVYTGEWDIWDHIALFTRNSLEETARIVGYREVLFNGKYQGVSPHRALDTRPGDDRDQLLGNIFADLLK